jgi:RHS repeat-associated protein
MAIDPATGRLAWTPPAGAAGSHVVSVEAVDPRGASGRQAFELRVRTANAAPRITSAPPAAQLTAGRIYQHDIEAEDPDGDLLRHELAAGPAAIEVHPVTGLVTWRTGPGDVGSHTATVRVADCCGGEAEAAFTIEVTPDVTPPALSIGFPTSPAPVGAIVEAWVSASDDVAVVSRTLTVECPPDAPRELTLDVIGRAQFASARTGYCTFRATATDPSGNVATATAVLQVGNPEDPLDPHPPVVQVLTPAPGSIITAPTSVAATISDATEDGKPGSGVLSWTVEIAPALSAMTTPGGGGGGGTPAGSEFRELGRGAGETLNAFLATFDPTMLPNGVYRLRIVASDGVQTGGVEYQVSVAGELKLGQFTFDAADLVASLAGLPIVISRRYDSLDSRSGDFGAGWRLAHPGEVEDSALELRTGNGLVDLLGTEPMKAGARVYVTRPDGRRIGFTFKPQALGGFLAMLHVATFEADQGVRDRLEVVEPAGHFFVIAGIASQVGVPYNPTVYRLTTEEGVSYLIDERAGLERMEDRNGNGIDVTPGGLFSALGPAVIFARDAAGRITRVVESGLTNPAEVTYAYDTGGNLVGATDVLGNETRYHYEESRFPHYLTRIDDPLGRPMLRNAYDDEGRLVGICGAGGDLLTLAGCTVIAWEPGTRASTMTDSRGFRIDRVFDERGRQLLERRYLDATRFLESRSEYDADGNLLRDVDASGEEWTYEYDAGGQQIVRRDPLGGTLVTTWDACGEPASDTGPDGSTVRFRYDASCNRIAIEEATGGEFSFAYDTYGDQTEVTDPVGNSWRFEYDGNGGLSKVVDPRGGSYLTQTGSGGDLLSRIDPDGRRADYVYDDAHRLVRETWNTVPPRVFTYEYDAAGQLVHATDGESSIRRDYLPTGRCSRVVTEGPAGAPEVSIDYQYDAGGNVTRVADSLGGITVTEYDGASRLLSIRQSGTGVREKRADFTWSNGSSAIEVRRFADLAGTVPVASTSFAYDCESCEDGPVSILHRRSADGSVIHQLEIERDPAGVVVAMTDAEGRHEYAHDAGMRLLHAVHPAGGIQPEEFYEYDAAGNRTASHRGSCVHAYTTAAGGNELQSDGVHRYETDGAGNVKRRIDLTTGASTEFRYDHRYRLTDVIERNPAGVETGRSSYAYDAMDNRVRATENGSVTHIVHDGRNPFLVLDGSGRVRTRRLYTRALDGVLADETGGVTRWFLTDHLGTIRDVVGDDGRTSAHLVYDSFGVLLQGSLAGPAGGLGFTAREYSEATGLYTLRAREYDPELGRFLRRDLLAPFQYDYAVSSPLSFVDPNGLAGRRPRPIDRPPWRRPPPPIRTPPRDFGPGYIPGYSHKWGPQGPGTYRTREPRGHGGGVLAEYATLLDSIAVPAILGGGFVTVAGATGVALAGAAAAVVFSSNIGL